LRGRHRECAVLGALLDGVRNGRSAALVVLGEAGVSAAPNCVLSWRARSCSTGSGYDTRAVA
jgi:hypothetical protein